MRFRDEVMLFFTLAAIIPGIVFTSLNIYHLRNLQEMSEAEEAALAMYYINDNISAVTALDEEFRATAIILDSYALAAESIYTGDIIVNPTGEVLLPWNGTAYPEPKDVPELKDEADFAARVGAYLGKVKPSIENSILIYMGTASGIFTANSSEAVHNISNSIGYDPAKRSWYTGAKMMNRTIWTAPYIDANTKHSIVTCARPVWHGDTFIGVIAVDVMTDYLDSRIALEKIRKNYATVLATNGTVIARAGPLSDDITAEMFQSELPGQGSCVQVVKIGGVEYYTYHGKMSSTGWDFYVFLEKEHWHENMRDSYRYESNVDFIIMTDAVLLMAVVVLSLYGVTRISQPIRDLAERAGRIAGGDLASEIKVRHGGELGKLEDAMERMAAQVRAAVYFLEEKEKEK